MTSIRVLAPEEVARRWGAIEPLLREATDRTHGCYEPIDILAQALVRKVVIWTVQADTDLLAVIVTEPRQFPRKQVLDIPFLAGERLEEWWPLFVEMMERHARECRCEAITALCGRAGWERFWRQHGIHAESIGRVVWHELRGESA